MKQSPSVGRAVHYYGEPNHSNETMSGPFHAIIVGLDPTEVDPNQVHLAVIVPGSDKIHPKTSTRFSEEPKKLHWSWPPRV